MANSQAMYYHIATGRYLAVDDGFCKVDADNFGLDSVT